MFRTPSIAPKHYDAAVESKFRQLRRLCHAGGFQNSGSVRIPDCAEESHKERQKIYLAFWEAKVRAMSYSTMR